MDTHLSRLKQIVESSNELCEGNCFWKHLTTYENKKIYNKQHNLFNFGKKAKRILEIGFNAGYSCLLFLLANSHSKIILFDINEHSYTKPCFEYLDSIFPNRLTLVIGNSVETVPEFSKKYPHMKFDLIHVNGGHDLEIVTKDLENVRKVASLNSILISDDDQIEHIHKLHLDLVEKNLLEPMEDVLPTFMYTHFIARFVFKQAGPLLINDVFSIYAEFNVEKIDDIIIIDNLFEDWSKVRQLFINTPALNWKMPEGTRNFIDYYDCRHYYKVHFGYPFIDPIKKIIKHVYGTEVKHEDNGIRTNWFKQIIPKKSNWAQIHQDWTEPGKEFTMITFLNTENECSGGTSFFKDIKEMDGHTGMDYWSKISKVNPLNIEMKPGRTIIFPSEIPHAAWHPIDSFYDFPRLNMVCRFIPVNDN